MDIEKWAESYIRVHDDRASTDESHPDFDAAYVFMDKLEGELAEDCWQGILAVLNRNPSDYVMGILAAGPLEDLIHYSGAEFIRRIEVEARKSPLFRILLNGVWQCGTSNDIWRRVQVARGELP